MRRATTLLVLLLLVTVRDARADDPSARQQFEDGVALMQSGRFAEAAQRLDASLALAPRPATAFNLAVALRGTGDVLAAVDRFERLLRGDYGKLTTASRRQAEDLLRETQAEIAVLSLHLRPSVPGAELRLDGARVTATGDDLELRVNPGERHVTYVAPDHDTVDARVILRRGEHGVLEVKPKPAVDRREGVLQLETTDRRAVLGVRGHRSGPSPLVQRLPPGTYQVSVRLGESERTTQLTVPAGRTVRLVLDPPKGRSIFASPWLWSAVGVVVVAVAVTTVVLATHTTERPPQTAPVWGVVEALESSR